MNLVLDDQSKVLIQEKVETGAYPDAPAVVREALRLLDERDRLDALRAELQIGLDQIERGELIDYTDDLLDILTHEAEEDERQGRPRRDAVEP